MTEKEIFIDFPSPYLNQLFTFLLILLETMRNVTKSTVFDAETYMDSVINLGFSSVVCSLWSELNYLEELMLKFRPVQRRIFRRGIFLMAISFSIFVILTTFHSPTPSRLLQICIALCQAVLQEPTDERAERIARRIFLVTAFAAPGATLWVATNYFHWLRILRSCVYLLLIVGLIGYCATITARWCGFLMNEQPIEERTPESGNQASQPVRQTRIRRRRCPCLVATSTTVTTGGKNVNIAPCKKFEDAELSEKMRANLIHAGYSRTTPIQQYSLPLVRDGHDIMACAQTGSGKTAAFLLPIMSRLLDENDLNTAGECGCYPRCIILTPTRELADQIYNEGIRFSYQTMVEIKPAYGALESEFNKSQLEKGATIIVGTFGRMKTCIEEGVIKLSKVKFLVFDEADRMFEADDNRDDFDQTVNYLDMIPKDDRQTLLFSANSLDTVDHPARRFLREDFTMIKIESIPVIQECFESVVGEKLKLLIDLLGRTVEEVKKRMRMKTIIFIRNKSTDLFNPLLKANHRAFSIKNSEDLRKQYSERPILIVTNAMEPQLEIKGVDHVINYDMPKNIGDYIQRIGRTGRVGKAGRATSFVRTDCPYIDDLAEALAETDQIVPVFMQGGTAGNHRASHSGNAHRAE